MLTSLIDIPLRAAALMLPFVVWLYILERRDHRRTKEILGDVQRVWVDRYRSLTDITLNVVEQNQRSIEAVERSYSLAQRTQDDMKHVALAMADLARRKQ